MLEKNIFNDYNVRMVQWREGKLTWPSHARHTCLRNMASICVRLISFPRDLKVNTMSSICSFSIVTTNKLNLVLDKEKTCHSAQAAPRLRITSLGQFLATPRPWKHKTNWNQMQQRDNMKTNQIMLVSQ